MSSPSERQAAGTVWALLGRLPDWLIVVLFVALAIILALAGQLDDWLRAALAVVFGLLAAASAARIAAHHDAGSSRPS